MPMQKEMDETRKRVTRRPVVLPDDEAFLRDLYIDTRDDLAAFISDQAELRQLLMMQYAGQTATFCAEFPNAKDEIVLLDDQAVGRLMLDHRSDSIHGVDIAVLKSSRNCGVGTCVLEGIFEMCSERGVHFTLNVVKNNPAIRLYERLGCRIDKDNGTHFLMVWRPQGSE
jgi:ribosomal protein S18 acetylase RimI-like enzyme